MTEKREPAFKLDMPFGKALARYARAKPMEIMANASDKERSKVEPTQGELELVHYETPEGSADFTLDPSNETLWATQQQMADAFGITTSTVRGHLASIYKESELDRTSVEREFRAIGSDGKLYKHLQYGLDAILSVGYRVSSRRGTAFRKWASGVLKDYLVQGFALNEARLKDDPHALRELAARVRAIRSDEKNIYRGVRDTFAFGSSDYDSQSEDARRFFTRLQDKFLYAITGRTAAQVILDRADADQHNMGLQAIKGQKPTSSDIHVGKNYLNESELYSLHILCEQFLLFVELRAMRGAGLTMIEMGEKFDDLLAVQEVPIFRDYDDYLKGRAKAHAEREYAVWKQQLSAPANKSISKSKKAG